MCEYNNIYVYGDDIAELKRSPSTEMFFRPMHERPSMMRDYLIGWDPVWAWECVIARERAKAGDTSAPSPVMQWNNRLDGDDLERMKNRILALESEDRNAFVIDPALIANNKVLDSYNSSDSWENYYPGLMTTPTRDPNNTHAYMGLSGSGLPLKKDFWYYGVWKRLSQMNSFLYGPSATIPTVQDSSVQKQTIKSLGGWTMPYSPESGFVYRKLTDVAPMYSEPLSWHFIRFNEGSAVENDPTVALTPKPYPSQEVSTNDDYVIFRVHIEKVNWNSYPYRKTTSTKYVIVRDDWYGQFTGFVSYIPTLKSLCGITDEPTLPEIESVSPEAVAICFGGSGVTEAFEVQVIDVVGLYRMNRTDVTFLS